MPNVTWKMLWIVPILTDTRGVNTTYDTLTRLHDHYVDAVNAAVAQGDEKLAAQLAAEFDVEALEAVRRRLAA